MTATQLDTVLQQFGTIITSKAAKKNASQLFKDHTHIPVIIDAINRKYTHHSLINTNLSARCLFHFCEALHAALSQHSRHKSNIMMLQLEMTFILSTYNQIHEQMAAALYEALSQQQHTLIICIPLPDHTSNDMPPADYLQHPFVRKLSAHPLCRILAFTETHCVMPRWMQQDYIELSLPSLTEPDELNILKLERITLEAHHQIIIPDELLTQTLTLAKQYLSTQHPIEKAILLLDSTSARAQYESQQDKQKSPPVLTLQMIANVLSSWIQIPAAQLISHHFNTKDFIAHLQQQIYEQDTAIELIAKHLQHHKTLLNAPKNAITHFVFAGPEHSGKKTAIHALAHYFYKQANMIHYVDGLSTGTDLLELPIKRSTHTIPQTLKTLIQQSPYAIIVFEHIEHATPSLLEELYRLLCNNQLEDQNHVTHSFHQACLILTTNLGSEHLYEAAHRPEHSTEQGSINLLQLIMNEKKAQETTNTPEALAKLIMNELSQKLPAKLCQKLTIIPFLPPNKAAIEKIFRLKLKEIGNHLRDHHAVIMGYAPEVIRHLTSRAMHHQQTEYNLKSIAQEIDICIEQALRHPRNHSHSNQLFLQLNETGQILRYDWLAATKEQAV